ncbi:MAG TPA: rhomboid family intramembrane serine protease [Candidatus Norongarragalinales archaeon]|nr:rhomboid family intramembrane serine protease [Candidatus Norongarragalinales archaeon]
MKFTATLLLVLGVLIPYYLLSNGTFYLPDDSLERLSFSNESSLQTYFTHLFTHVGLQHLASNLVPLILFGLLLEAAGGSVHVLAVFLLSGMLSSILFTTLNPLVILVGASTGVSGLMASSVILSPKRGLVLLLATLLLLSVSQPLVSAYNDYQVQRLAQEKRSLEESVQTLLAQNRIDEAAAQNQTLAKVETTLVQTTSGIKREQETPTDLLVHLFGAFFGAAYAFVFLRKKLEAGVREFEEIGEFMFEKIPAFLRNKNKG